MDFLLPLTIIGFLISIYGVSEDHKKRNLKFKFGIGSKIWLGFLSLIILSLVLLDIFWLEQPARVIWSFWGYDITWTLLISILAIIVSGILVGFFWKRLNSKKLIQKELFAKNVKYLLGRKMFSEILSDLSVYFEDIFNSKNKELKNVETDLINDDEFVQYLIDKDSLLAVKILFKVNPSEKQLLWDKLGRNFMKDTSGRFYRELNPEFTGNAPITDSLFKNLKNASDYLLWKPIGDSVSEYLGKLANKKMDPNNLYESRYDLKKVSSPIHTGIEFFRRMVFLGINQNIENHLDLMYYQYFVEEIIKNYNIKLSKQKNSIFSSYNKIFFR